MTIAYLLTIVSFPIRAIGWLLGEFPRSVVGFRRIRSVLRATGAVAYGEASLPDSTRARGSSWTASATPTTPSRCCEEVSFVVEPGRPSRWSAPPPRARAP